MIASDGCAVRIGVSHADPRPAVGWLRMGEPWPHGGEPDGQITLGSRLLSVDRVDDPALGGPATFTVRVWVPTTPDAAG